MKKKSHSRYDCETNLLRVTNSRIENLPVFKQVEPRNYFKISNNEISKINA